MKNTSSVDQFIVNNAETLKQYKVSNLNQQVLLEQNKIYNTEKLKAIVYTLYYGWNTVRYYAVLFERNENSWTCLITSEN